MEKDHFEQYFINEDSITFNEEQFLTLNQEKLDEDLSRKKKVFVDLSKIDETSKNFSFSNKKFMFNIFKVIVSAFEKLETGTIILTRVDTGAKYWSEFVFPKAVGICFIKNSILGINSELDSVDSFCLIYYGRNYENFEKTVSVLGSVLKFNNSHARGFINGKKVIKVSRAEVAAAKAMIEIKSRLGEEVSEAVKKIADAKIASYY